MTLNERIIGHLTYSRSVAMYSYFLPGITYLTKLVGVAMLIYLIISWTTIVYVGYVLLAVLIYLLIQLIVKLLKAMPEREG